ncbi:thioredoxin, partial [Macrococcoides caseolyticum]
MLYESVSGEIKSTFSWLMLHQQRNQHARLI